MSFIQLTGIEDAHEAIVAPDGRYPLVVTSADIKSKDGKTNIFCIIEIEARSPKGETYANVMHNISMPGPGDDDDKRRNKLLFAKRFFHQFKIPYEGGIETDAIVGARAEVNLAQDEYQGQWKNVLRLDQLPEGV